MVTSSGILTLWRVSTHRRKQLQHWTISCADQCMVSYFCMSANLCQQCYYIIIPFTVVSFPVHVKLNSLNVRHTLKVTLIQGGCCTEVDGMQDFSATLAIATYRCVKLFPPKTRADVGMVQCVSEGHGKPPGRKTIGTRRRGGPCKEGAQPVHAKPRSIRFADFEYICTIPTSGNILLRFLLVTA